MLKTILENVNYPIEHLVFQLDDSSKVNEFIRLDEAIWTHELSQYDGFLSKEVWVNADVPGEVHTLLIWKTMEDWKSIPLDKLKEIDQRFIATFGSPFRIVRRIHKENNHGLYKVRMTVKAD